MRFLTKLLPIAAAAGMLAGLAQPATAEAGQPGVRAERVGYWYDPPPRWVPGPPPRRYYRPPPPPPRYWAPPPPPVYYAPPPPPRPRYYYGPPRPGVGLYFRF